MCGGGCREGALQTPACNLLIHSSRRPSTQEDTTNTIHTAPLQMQKPNMDTHDILCLIIHCSRKWKKLKKEFLLLQAKAQTYRISCSQNPRRHLCWLTHTLSEAAALHETLYSTSRVYHFQPGAICLELLYTWPMFTINKGTRRLRALSCVPQPNSSGWANERKQQEQLAV